MSVDIEINTANDKSGNPVIILQIAEHKTILPAKDAIDIGTALIQGAQAAMISFNQTKDVQNEQESQNEHKSAS